MSDYAKLKELAEAAKRNWPDSKIFDRPECERFIDSARPDVVLELIADAERNQRMLLAACVDMGAIGNALGADMNSDGEELLSLVVDIKAENNRMREFLKDISKTSGDKGAVMGARQLLKEFDQ